MVDISYRNDKNYSITVSDAMDNVEEQFRTKIDAIKASRKNIYDGWKGEVIRVEKRFETVYIIGRVSKNNWEFPIMCSNGNVFSFSVGILEQVNK